MKKRIAPLVIGIVTIVLITVVVTNFSARLSGRWGDFEGIEEARAAIKSLPMKIDGAVGTWEAEGDRELNAQDIKMLQIKDSYVLRTFRNSVTGEFVNLTLMVGQSGKITVHTPDICFGGRDYEKDADRSRVTINVDLRSGEEIVDTFWRISFSGRTLDVNNRILFYYGISTGGAWNAIDNPRWTLRDKRYVYKLQVEAYSGSNEGGDTVKRFLEDCLSTIHEHMRPCK